MSGSDQRRATVPEVARLLGISERGVRDKIERGQLQAEKDGKRWIVTLPPDAPEADAVVSGSASGSGAVVDAVAGGSTPAEVERAIEATASRYMADFAGLYDRISADVAARFEQTIAAKDETIAALRRRAEVAETELSLRSEELSLERSKNGPPAAPQPRTAEEARHASDSAPDAPAPAGGLWARVRRVLGGEGRR